LSKADIAANWTEVRAATAKELLSFIDLKAVTQILYTDAVTASKWSQRLIVATAAQMR